jgi:hypothetical protein
MEIIQRNEKIKFKFERKGNFDKLKKIFENKQLSRFAIVDYINDHIECEYAEISNINSGYYKNIFDFNPTTFIDETSFNVVQIIPTGIRADVGGNSGDGNPSAKLLGNVADTLITHPNVVNAADINEMTSNTLYVEGSILNRFMMGNAGLAPTRKNKILLIYDTNKSNYYHNFRPLNMASAARVTLGCEIDTLEVGDAPYYQIFYNELGMATGKIENLEKLTNIIEKHKNEYDSFILYTLLDGDTQELLNEYYSEKNMANPWGSTEAILTHTISNLYDIPCAHAPVLEKMFLEYPFEIVDPRKTPEILSTTELFCTIKGMYKSPKIVKPTFDSGIFTNRNINALVTPDRCIGLPLIAALEQNIPVIAIEDETNLMKNDLSILPWNNNQFFKAKNYLEAAGILIALKSGIDPYSVIRPMSQTKIIK